MYKTKKKRQKEYQQYKKQKKKNNEILHKYRKSTDKGTH